MRRTSLAQSSASRSAGVPILVALLAALAAGLVILSTRQGPGLSPDSVGYLSGARSIATSGQYTGYTNTPITIWPPGFPGTLAVGLRLGVDATTTARWLNALALGAVVSLTFVLARRHVSAVAFATGAAAAVAVSESGVRVASFVWSETVFCVVTLALLLVLERLVQRQQDGIRLIVAAAGLVSIGFLYRYGGVTLFGVTMVVIVVTSRPHGGKLLARQLLIFLAFATIVPAIVMMRNLAHGVGVMGSRGSSTETLTSVAMDLYRAIGAWIIPAGGEPTLEKLGMAAVAILLVTGLTMAMRQRRHDAPCARASLLPIVAFVAIYVAYLVGSELTTNIDPIGTRLAVPVLAPSAVLAVIVLERILEAATESRRARVARVIGALAVIWLLGSLAVTAHQSRERGTYGQGYGGTQVRNSELAREVASLSNDAVVYSNDAPRLYVVTERKPIYYSPRAKVYRSATQPNDLSNLRKHLGAVASSAYLAWFTPNRRSFLLTPRQLTGAGIDLEKVVATTDGTLYRIGFVGRGASS